MKKRNNRKTILTVTILVISMIMIFGFNAISANTEDVTEIERVLIQSSTIADEMYIDTNSSFKAKTLDENADYLLSTYTTKFFNIFSESINVMNKFSGKTMKEVWIDAQIANVNDGPDCINCGVSKIVIKDISISNDTANVTAVVTKYLVDRVIKDGKSYLNKMEAEVLKTATLVKEDNQWKIVKYESNPDYGECIQTSVEEK